MGAVIADRPELTVADGARAISIRPASKTHWVVLAALGTLPAGFVGSLGAAPSMKFAPGFVPALRPASLRSAADAIPDRLELFSAHGSIVVFVDFVKSLLQTLGSLVFRDFAIAIGIHPLKELIEIAAEPPPITDAPALFGRRGSGSRSVFGAWRLTPAARPALSGRRTPPRHEVHELPPVELSILVSVGLLEQFVLKLLELLLRDESVAVGVDLLEGSMKPISSLWSGTRIRTSLRMGHARHHQTSQP